MRPPPSSLSLSDAERDYIRDGICMDCRVDGRRRHDIRRYAVQTGIYPLSHGSASIDRHCSVSISAELVQQAPTIIIECQQKRISFMEDYLLAYLRDYLSIMPSSSSPGTTMVYWKLSVDVMLVDDGMPTSFETIAQCIRYGLLDTRLPVVAVVEPMIVDHDPASNQKSGAAVADRKQQQSMIERISLVPDATRPLIDANKFGLTLVSVYEVSTTTTTTGNNNNKNAFFLDADDAERAISAVTHVAIVIDDMDVHSDGTANHHADNGDSGRGRATVIHCQGNPAAVPIAVSARKMIDQQYQLDRSQILMIK